MIVTTAEAEYRRMSSMRFLLLFACCFLPLTSPAAPIFLEKGGILAIEAESTTSSLKKWKKKTDVADFSGECHLEFTGNRIMSGPPHSPLKYRFTIRKGGKYTLTLRGRKRLESKREDLSNDCYVAVKGDFEAGGKAPLKILKSDTKMYGGDPDGWAWTKNLDADHKKFPAEYLFKGGETYTLTISGRSKNFNLDRILFVHDAKNLKEICEKNPPESKTAASADSEPERVTRTLTNLDGKSITAELISLKEDQLILLFKGRRLTIDPATLSQEDQDFLKEWIGE